MDPKQTLLDARAAADAGDLHEARELVRAYIAWRSKGGFQPNIDGRCGDQYANFIMHDVQWTKVRR